MKKLILCLGNELAGDDGVGIYIGRRLKGKVKGWDVKCSNSAGFYLIEEMEGYQEVILVDSIIVREGRAGEIIEGELRENPATSALHSLSLPQALSLARAMGMKVPRKLKFIAISIPPPALGEELSPEIKKAAEEVISRLLLL